MVSILTYKIKHELDLSEEFAKARAVAKRGIDSIRVLQKMFVNSE